MAFGLAMVAAATLAGWSWLSVLHPAVAGRPVRPGVEPAFRRREATLLVCWAALSGTARLLGVLPAGPAHPVGDALLLASSVLALLAGASVLRRITRAAGGLGLGLAQAALISASIVTLVWVLTGAPLRPPVAAVLAAAPAMVDLATSTLVLRLVVLVPEALNRGANRERLLLCAGAVAVVGGGNALHGLAALGVSSPAWLGSLVVVAGYLLAAAVPRIEVLPRAADRPPPALLRLLPCALVVPAVGAVCLQAVLAQTGPAPVLLATLVVAGLVTLQVLGLQENDRLRADLHASRLRLNVLVENTSDLIVRLDANGRVLAANAAAVRLLHRTPMSLAGRSFDDLARPEERRAVREAVQRVTRGRDQSAQVELTLAPPAAGTAQLRLRAVPGGAVANLNDVTDAVELRRRLERLAHYDQMTGLVNRSHLLDVVGSWLAEPTIDVAILYCDLDGFKAVNDRFGHGAGDRVLIEVAGRLEAVAGAVDARRVIVGRIGGDEFIIGLEGIAPVPARLAAQRVVAAITPSFVVGDRTVQLGASVGVAGCGPSHRQAVADGAADLVHRADLAMYAAKAGGRDQVAAWAPELEEAARRRVDIAIGLRGALDTGRLAVAYQPIVRLVDGVVVGAEALLRLPPGVDPAALGLDALVSPAELVAVAEDTGTIIEMGEWVLTQAVQEAAGWAAAGLSGSVSVNMSVQQLLQPSFVDTVAAVLRSCGLPAGRLVLELTESQLVGRTGPALLALERLRATGVRLAIDDFGTGYSSLSYLRRMPVQLVKIDRTLLDDMGVDPRATALARSVVSMARDLGLLVVAEGMEDMASVLLLRDLGAYAGQGFALSSALPPREMAEMLAGPPLSLTPPCDQLLPTPAPLTSASDLPTPAPLTTASNDDPDPAPDPDPDPDLAPESEDALRPKPAPAPITNGHDPVTNGHGPTHGERRRPQSTNAPGGRA